MGNHRPKTANKFEVGAEIAVLDRMQSDYRYTLSAPIAEDFKAGFSPHFSPREMLSLGVFDGKYINDCRGEFPADWYRDAKLSDRPNPEVNFFAIKSRQPLAVWRDKGWIIGPDPRGWFQWYCRYYLGRRLAEVDAAQIKRWRAFARHKRQVELNCLPGDLGCRPRQRQALLQWSYDPFI